MDLRQASRIAAAEQRGREHWFATLYGRPIAVVVTVLVLLLLAVPVAKRVADGAGSLHAPSWGRGLVLAIVVFVLVLAVLRFVLRDRGPRLPRL
jgi:hypothetical protein